MPLKSTINAIISADAYNIIIEEYANEFDCFFETKESDFMVGQATALKERLGKFPSKKMEILSYFKQAGRVGDRKVFSVYEKALDHFQLELRNIVAHKFTMPWTRIYIQLK